MDQIQNQSEPAAPQFSIRRGARFGRTFAKFINEILIILSLRGRRKFWGVVYDSVSKEPLDPVIVKLVYVGSDRVVETCVTDLGGGYGFLARPGSFKILATKSNYTFPSKIATGSNDGIYRDLYHGEFFHLTGGSEVIAPNIPMDPVNFDWNQQAKRDVFRTHPFRDRMFRGVVSVIFWYGFVYTLAYAVKEFWQGLSLHTPWIIITLSLYALSIILTATVPHVRLWGIVKERKTGQPLGGVKLTLTNPDIPGMTLGSAVTNDAGRFLLRSRPGRYVAKVSLKNPSDGFEEIGTVPLRAGEDGVINETIYIKQSV